MGITAVLLAPALESTGYIMVPIGWPAQCLLTHGRDLLVVDGSFSDSGYDSVYVAIVMVFLSSSYLSRVVQLFPLAPPAIWKFFLTRPNNTFQMWLVSLRNRIRSSSTKSSIFFWFMAHRILLSTYCLLKAMADLYGSLLWEVRLNLALFILFHS